MSSGCTRTSASLRSRRSRPGRPGPAGQDAISSRLQFDGFGRIRHSYADGPDGKTIIVDKDYDGRGNLARETLPYYSTDHSAANPPPRTTYRYDALDRQIARILPDSQTYKTDYGFNYDFESFRWEATIDPTGRKISATRYDAFDRVRATEQWKDNNTQADTVFSWDAADQLVRIRDPIGAEWIYRYDTLGRRVYASDPDLGVTTYWYDVADRLVRQTDARGSKISIHLRRAQPGDAQAGAAGHRSGGRRAGHRLHLRRRRGGLREQGPAGAPCECGRPPVRRTTTRRAG